MLCDASWYVYMNKAAYTSQTYLHRNAGVGVYMLHLHVSRDALHPHSWLAQVGQLCMWGRQN